MKLRSVAIWILLWTALAALYLPSLSRHIRASRLCVNDDAFQQVTPFLRALDSEGPRDYIERYWMACLPVGYKALYRGVGQVIDPRTISRFLPYVLFAVFLAGALMAAHRIGGMTAAWGITALAVSADVFLSRMAGGLPRGFAFPFFSLACAGVLAGRPFLVAAATCLGALFYPAIAVPSGLALALMLFVLPQNDRGAASHWPMRRRIVVTGLTALLCALCVLPTLMATKPYGPSIRPDELETYPEAAQGGRFVEDDRVDFNRPLTEALRLYPLAALHNSGKSWVPDMERWAHRHQTFLIGFTWCFILTGGLWAAITRTSGRRLLTLTAASIASYLLARALTPALFMAQRHAFYTLPVLLLLWLFMAAVVWGDALKRWMSFFPLRLKAPSSLFIFAVCLFYLALTGGNIPPRNGLNNCNGPGGLDLFAASLPSDAFLAGWPNDMSAIPYYAAQPVLICYENHLPRHHLYTEVMRERMRDLIAAYFARESLPIVRLKEKWGVTHLVVHPAHFSGSPPRYFRPFNNWILNAAKNGGEFEVFQQRHSAEVYADEAFFVLDLGKIAPTGP